MTVHLLVVEPSPTLFGHVVLANIGSQIQFYQWCRFFLELILLLNIPGADHLPFDNLYIMLYIFLQELTLFFEWENYVKSLLRPLCLINYCSLHNPVWYGQ